MEGSNRRWRGAIIGGGKHSEEEGEQSKVEVSYQRLRGAFIGGGKQ